MLLALFLFGLFARPIVMINHRFWNRLHLTQGCCFSVLDCSTGIAHGFSLQLYGNTDDRHTIVEIWFVFELPLMSFIMFTYLVLILTHFGFTVVRLDFSQTYSSWAGSILDSQLLNLIDFVHTFTKRLLIEVRSTELILVRVRHSRIWLIS